LIYQIISLTYLTINSITDIREKRISIIISLIFGAIGIIINIIFNQYNIISILLAMLLGFIMILISKVTKEAIGIGDGIILVVMGLFTGVYNNLLILLYGLILSSIVSCFFLITKKLDKKDKIPFIPYLLAGYIIILAVEEF
jgi:prepilin signal peptidase PulO-like enzyme (type II secretory pathway)